jgi:hypothetical protein
MKSVKMKDPEVHDMADNGWVHWVESRDKAISHCVGNITIAIIF